MTTEELVRGFNVIIATIKDRQEREQERIDEEGAGPTLAGLAWKITKKGRWKYRPLV